MRQMRLRGAISILFKECEFLGVTMHGLIKEYKKNPLSFPNRTLQAFEVFKKDYPEAF